MSETMLLATLIDIGVSGVVGFVLWLVIHYKTKAIVERLGKVEQALEKHSGKHEGLGREFSELRGTIRGWLGHQSESAPWFPREHKPRVRDEQPQ